MVCALVGVPLAMANEWADGIRAKPGAGTFDHHQLARLNKALELTNGRTSRRYWLNDRGERFVRLKPGEPIRLIPYREPEAVDILPEPIPFRKR